MEGNSNFIEWDGKLELGIPLIDEQHKKLIQLYNNLNRKVIEVRSGEKEGWQESLKFALQDCSNYVLTHFKDEEALQRAAGFEGYEQHKQAHDTFTRNVISNVKNYNQANLAAAVQFTKFLDDWIYQHIAHEDKHYVKSVLAYLKTKGEL